MNNEIYFEAKREMDRRFPQEELGYRNGIVATAIAKGRKEKLTEDWLRKTLLMDVEDGFLSYEQAVYIHKDYYKAIEEVKEMF